MNLNKVFVIGRLTADPQLRSTPSGQAVTSFGVATNRYWKDKSGGRQEETEFHNVVVWGRQAEVATQYLKKGALVYIEGRLRTRTWEDRQNQSHRTTEVICERLQLGPAPRGAGAASPAAGRDGESRGDGRTADSTPSEEVPSVDIDDDVKAEDLPF